MAALSKVDALIAHARELPEQQNPIVYDPEHFLAYGRWLCTGCKRTFSSLESNMIHGLNAKSQECALKSLQDSASCKGNSKMIYVMGPRERAPFSLFKKEELAAISAKVKEIAQQQQILPTPQERQAQEVKS